MTRCHPCSPHLSPEARAGRRPDTPRSFLDAVGVLRPSTLAITPNRTADPVDGGGPNLNRSQEQKPQVLQGPPWWAQVARIAHRLRVTRSVQAVVQRDHRRLVHEERILTNVWDAEETAEEPCGRLLRPSSRRGSGLYVRSRPPVDRAATRERGCPTSTGTAKAVPGTTKP